ncbi:hypothetical protein BV22DRAFT_699313 [Leucogyrophana mollusca]|uniref:Uncharacterized protein n=1 Tax=Leucogyrophana mollusca TaxID=85980 RepID=A0ACB8B9I4_9AGAM|nr:hypothetical protein BV22DRAFT_699313 [Leucogyrophana mollusca]
MLDDTKANLLLKSAKALAWDRAQKAVGNPPFSFSSSHKIADTLILKGNSVDEAANMDYVRKHTTIPVPQPRYSHLSTWLAMDLVEGKSLLECWEKQSLLMKFRIACTMRGYISQLRLLTGTIPGTVAHGRVRGILFDDSEQGPFESSTRFRQWCEMVAQSGWTSTLRYRRTIQAPENFPAPPTVGGEWPLVLTHADLNLSNIILSDDGVLWVIDWATSGFFPPWLESVAMSVYSDEPRSWRRFRWFIAGTSARYEAFWDLFITDVHRFHTR